MTESFRLTFEPHPADGPIGVVIATALTQVDNYLLTLNLDHNAYVNAFANIAVNALSILATAQPPDFIPTVVAALYNRLPLHRQDLADSAAAQVTDQIFKQIKDQK